MRVLTENTVADAHAENATSDDYAYPMYGDAKNLTQYREQDNEDDIWVTHGPNRWSKEWTPKKMPRAAVIGKLCKHEVGEKEGEALVFADMVPGQRLKNAVKAVYAIGLDIDNGTPTKRIDDALKKLDCVAVRYTTHSHLKTKTQIRKDEVLRVFKGLRNVEDIDTDVMRRYCREVEKWDEALALTIEFESIVHVSEGKVSGIMVEITHAPMHKNRVIVFLKEPYDMATAERTQIEAMKNFSRLPAMLADHLQVPFIDEACKDPSRLFYTPRHKEGAEFSISVFGGKLLDWRELKLSGGDAYDVLDKLFGNTQSKSKTPRGKGLGKWANKRARGFQIAEVIHDHAREKYRGSATMGITIECPFDEGHSNAGDPDDTACFAVNAAEGGNEIPIISCRHGSCQEYTWLDHLGKMLEDGWFDEDVLTNEAYNIAILDEDEAKAKGAQEPNAEPESEARTDTNDAKGGKSDSDGDYEAAISELSAESSDAEIERAIRKLLKAKLSIHKRDKAEKLLAKKLKLTKAKVENLIAQVRKESGMWSGGTEKAAADGKATFRYEGRYDFEEAAKACRDAVLVANSKAEYPDFGIKGGYPVVSAMDGYPVLLTIQEDGRAKIEEMTRDSFWAYLTSLIAFVITQDNKDREREKVPEDVSKYLFERSAEWLPKSPKIIYSPTLLADGTLLETPGFHKNKEYGVNHLFIRMPDFIMPAIPKHPTKEDALASLAYIREELLNDFPFLDTDDEDVERRDIAEANALAMLITPFMRDMIPGRTPLFMASKPIGGTGGSALTDMPMLIHEGEVAPYIEYTSDPDEMSKRLITAVRTGTRHLYFDDTKEMRSKTLHRALTAPKVAGRRMGTNDLVEAPNNFNWIGNGNNPFLDYQMDRRTVWVRLNAKQANVLDREFRHRGEDGPSKLTLEQFCVKHRGTIIAHILTIILYWFESEEKPFSGKKRLGFETFSARVGGVLEAIGVKGFLQGKSGVLASPEAANDLTFMHEWLAKYGTDVETPLKALEWAKITGAAILRGNGDDLKKGNFLSDLHRLTDNTFVLQGLDGKVREYEFKTEVRKTGPVYYLKELK